MRIIEILQADWNIAWIEVTIRGMDHRLIRKYIIGKDIKPGNHWRFVREDEKKRAILWEVGYQQTTMTIDKEIQNFHSEKAKPSEYSCVGYISGSVPDELALLEVNMMRPSTLHNYGGYGSNFHGYHIEAEVDDWQGVYPKFERFGEPLERGETVMSGKIMRKKEEDDNGEGDNV